MDALMHVVKNNSILDVFKINSKTGGVGRVIREKVGVIIFHQDFGCLDKQKCKILHFGLFYIHIRKGPFFISFYPVFIDAELVTTKVVAKELLLGDTVGNVPVYIVIEAVRDGEQVFFGCVL